MANDPQTWDELVASAAEWLNRSDLDDKIPEFIAFAERKFNRTLRTVEMEARSTAVLTGDSLELPSDFLALRSIQVDDTVLAYITPDETFAATDQGSPLFYTITDGQFFFRPIPDSGDVTLTYYAAIPALSVSEPTNWLLTAHPDIYLWATLLQAEAYIWNDQRLELWKTALDEALAELLSLNRKKRSGPIRLRSPIIPV